MELFIDWFAVDIWFPLALPAISNGMCAVNGVNVLMWYFAVSMLLQSLLGYRGYQLTHIDWYNVHEMVV